MVWSSCCLIFCLLSATTVWSQNQPVESNDYPWMVAVYTTVGYFPIGSGLIINKHWVLTPAQFWKSKRFRPGYASIKYGATVNREGEGKVGTINEVFIHPDFNSVENDMAYDVALLLMKPELELDWEYKELMPIEDEIVIHPPGVLCSVFGYGVEDHQKADDLNPRHLKKTEVEIESSAQCQAELPFPNEMICAGPKTGSSLCPGYEGAMLKCGERFYGMFIKGMECPSNKISRVNVYLRLGLMKDFMTKVMMND